MNADPIARWYRIFEYGAFGRGLERRRLAFLSTLAGSQKALILGDGDGRFVQALLVVNPGIAVDLVEASSEMIRLSAKRITNTFGRIPPNVWLHRADARLFAPPASDYDLIATHFFLDCFEQDECEHLIAHISQCAAPGALWAISEFVEPAAGLQKHWARILIRLCYLFFRLTTGLTHSSLPAYPPALTKCGFTLLRREVSRTGMLVSELWQKS